MICLTGLTFTGQAGIIGHTILMGGAVMADIFIRALPKYAPDLIVLLADGRVLLIEMKKPKGGEVSEAQAGLHATLTAMGHMVGVATCQDTARHLLHLWGIQTREAAGAPMREAKVRVAKPKK